MNDLRARGGSNRVYNWSLGSLVFNNIVLGLGATTLETMAHAT
jgi:hypothetical protein